MTKAANSFSPARAEAMSGGETKPAHQCIILLDQNTNRNAARTRIMKARILQPGPSKLEAEQNAGGLRKVETSCSY
jgi:hypothetical protein